MIKFRYKRKEVKETKENVASNNANNGGNSDNSVNDVTNKLIMSAKKDVGNSKKDGKPPKGVKKEYLECVRAVVVSLNPYKRAGISLLEFLSYVRLMRYQNIITFHLNSHLNISWSRA